jgi:asparagine synthase (glutamine-hydrolysing)
MSEISSFPIETFTIGYKEKSFDERDLAKQVAQKFHTIYHEHIIEPDTFNESLSTVSYHYDEPFGDSSAIPTGYVSKFASSKVKVVLTGDGGDELLSGYTNYQGEKFSSQYQKLPAWLRTGFPFILSKIANSLSGNIRYKLNRIQNVCNSSNLSFIDRYLFKTAFIEVSTIKLLTKGHNVYPVEEFLNDFMKKCSFKDPFYKLMNLNLKLSLPDAMCVKVDRMSMAHSLETRAPFLDHRLIEYMVKVHKDVKMHHYERKTILRNVTGPKLPASLLKAPKKGFTIPLREWFKEDAFISNLDDLGKTFVFGNNNIIDEIVLLNKKGKKDYGHFIWMLFVLNKILEK